MRGEINMLKGFKNTHQPKPFIPEGTPQTSPPPITPEIAATIVLEEPIESIKPETPAPQPTTKEKEQGN